MGSGDRARGPTEKQAAEIEAAVARRQPDRPSVPPIFKSQGLFVEAEPGRTVGQQYISTVDKLPRAPDGRIELGDGYYLPYVVEPYRVDAGGPVLLGRINFEQRRPPADGLAIHSFALRRDAPALRIALPLDLSAREADRLAAFIKSLPFDADD